MVTGRRERPRIVTFGNCQAQALARVLALALPDEYEPPKFLSNNRRTGGMKSPEKIIAALQHADIVIFQPLNERHRLLSEARVRASLRESVVAVTFPYIFNTGIAGVCQAANATDHSYGRIYGERFVLDRLGTKPVDEVIAEYLNGTIDFRLRRRFDHCVSEMAGREATTDIQLTEFIVEHQRSKRLFLTHNHPSTALLAEICEQVNAVTGLPIAVDRIRCASDENLGRLPFEGVRCPISPHDQCELGFEFPHDPCWAEAGPDLIRLIAEGRCKNSLQPLQRGNSQDRSWERGRAPVDRRGASRTIG